MSARKSLSLIEEAENEDGSVISYAHGSIVSTYKPSDPNSQQKNWLKNVNNGIN